MTVIILREVLKAIEVPFRLSDKKAVLVSKLKEAKAHDNQSFNYSQSSLSGSTSAAQSTQEVSSDQEITDVNNLKFSPSFPRLKISRLRPNDYRHGEQHFQTIIYHNLRIEPLFTRVQFQIKVYGAKVITSVLLDYFLLLAFSAIYYVYASFLIQLTEIIKTLIVSFILLHIYGVAIARLEGCTPLIRPQLPLLLEPR